MDKSQSIVFIASSNFCGLYFAREEGLLFYTTVHNIQLKTKLIYPFMNSNKPLNFSMKMFITKSVYCF